MEKVLKQTKKNEEELQQKHYTLLYYFPCPLCPRNKCAGGTLVGNTGVELGGGAGGKSSPLAAP